ncbi:hypothetical protein PPYR_00269 [Photinus pyralis]|uniref:DUF7869 domain-containing protein n=2 Tax=Photinus pyralis TaxID=7054 RepID=A0A5N4B121_PHOPY|nr:uncharacterized protein LOC116169024 [Photinus pyralis]KAB0803299.1 hypothetical protein PPYR_00269 [Photinus pyralis]
MSLRSKRIVELASKITCLDNSDDNARTSQQASTSATGTKILSTECTLDDHNKENDGSNNLDNEDGCLENESDIEETEVLSGRDYSECSDDDPTYIPEEYTDRDNILSENVQVIIEDKENNILVEKKKRRSSAKVKKLSRKRIRNTDQWVDTLAKKGLDSGIEHENRKGKLIKARKIGKGCASSCRFKCRDLLVAEKQESIFKDFWELGSHTRQWDFVSHCVKQVNKKQVTVAQNSQSRRKFSREYYFKIENQEKRVCKTMFLHTLGISERWVSTALSKVKDSGAVEEDNRGKHQSRPNKINEDVKEIVREHIKLFPVVPSHYTRKNTQKLYLEDGLNIQRMYRLYLEFAKTMDVTNVASSRQYRDIFNGEFNLSFFKPKKDQCDLCIRYTDTDKGNPELQEKYDSHITNKNSARSLKDQDKLIALNNKSIIVACFDLQKVLVTPKSEVSIFYYKSKYATYNFTVYDIGNHKGYCYVWHESVAKRGANEIGSCLWKFLDTAANNKNIQEVIFYSDNCGGQNRNRFIFSMFQLAACVFNKKITHRFFEKGHTQNEGDCMHAVIENAKNRQQVVYTPEQWVTLIRMAKVTGTPYDVTEMSQKDFYNLKKLVIGQNWKTDEDGQQLKISKVREIVLLGNPDGRVDFKYEYTDAPKSLNIYKKRRGRPSCCSRADLQQLYDKPLPVDKKKLDGLLELCNKRDIPEMYHGFYRSLSYNKAKNTTEETVNNEETSTEEQSE